MFKYQGILEVEECSIKKIFFWILLIEITNLTLTLVDIYTNIPCSKGDAPLNSWSN
jgi:hypothetical protein